MAFVETRIENSIGTITLNRPDKLNAFAGTMREDLLQTLRSFETAHACRVVVITGAGCNLALACHYRIASDQARLSESFVRIGLHPDWGRTRLLPRLVGRSRAFELMLTGRMVEAQEALAIGMVDRVVPAADLAAETEKLARTMAAGPPLAIAAIKSMLRQSETNNLGVQVELESEHQRRAFQSKDAEEGLKAFLEKRAPLFRGE